MNLAFANLFQNGAQGRDRTTDTAIFSRMLYQLSYLGTSGREAAWERRFIVRLACPVHHASPLGYAWRSPAWHEGPRGPAMTEKRWDRVLTARNRAFFRSIGAFVVVLGGGDGVGIRQPAVQIDIPAAFGTKRARSLGRGLAADRAGLGRSLGR